MLFLINRDKHFFINSTMLTRADIKNGFKRQIMEVNIEKNYIFMFINLTILSDWSAVKKLNHP